MRGCQHGPVTFCSVGGVQHDPLTLGGVQHDPLTLGGVQHDPSTSGSVPCASSPPPHATTGDPVTARAYSDGARPAIIHVEANIRSFPFFSLWTLSSGGGIFAEFGEVCIRIRIRICEEVWGR
jgi:hypothetical protein